MNLIPRCNDITGILPNTTRTGLPVPTRTTVSHACNMYKPLVCGPVKLSVNTIHNPTIENVQSHISRALGLRFSHIDGFTSLLFVSIDTSLRCQLDAKASSPFKLSKVLSLRLSNCSNNYFVFRNQFNI